MIKRITVNSHTYNNYMTYQMLKGTGWLLDYLTTHTSLSTIRRGFAPGFVNYKKGALDSQPKVIKFTSCLPIVGGFSGYSGFFHH
jgi:hypothetical protein